MSHFCGLVPDLINLVKISITLIFGGNKRSEKLYKNFNLHWYIKTNFKTVGYINVNKEKDQKPAKCYQNGCLFSEIKPKNCYPLLKYWSKIKKLSNSNKIFLCIFINKWIVYWIVSPPPPSSMLCVLFTLGEGLSSFFTVI